MKNKKKVRRGIMAAIIVTVALLVMLFAVWIIISPGTIRTYKGDDYEKMLEAPDKGFYLIPNAAHSPLWENPQKTCEILRQIKENNTNE